MNRQHLNWQYRVDSIRSGSFEIIVLFTYSLVCCCLEVWRFFFVVFFIKIKIRRKMIYQFRDLSEHPWVFGHTKIWRPWRLKVLSGNNPAATLFTGGKTSWFLGGFKSSFQSTS